MAFVLCDLQDYVCEVDQSTYSSMSYTTIEISSSLAAAQQEYIIGVSSTSACL
jgi:precorrin-2 methylase